MILFVFICCWSYVESSLSYTIESRTVDGRECLNDCVIVNGKNQCWTTSNEQVLCNPGWRQGAIYYTSRFKYPSVSKCVSKCAAGKEYSWCYIDNEFNWDYCNSDTKIAYKWYEYATTYGRCKDDCGHRRSSYLWCHTFWDSWDYCEKRLYYEEEVKTVYGGKCFGLCHPYDGTHYWCFDENRAKTQCAPSPVFYGCLSHRRRARSAPIKTVEDYNTEIESDNFTTVIINEVRNQDIDNPVLDYTYRQIGNLKLPVRIRARIRPLPYFKHLRRNIWNKMDDISSAARVNCKHMGMNAGLPNGNDDELGLLVPYIVGGPSDWFNVVPQTMRINRGTFENSFDAPPSIWGEIARQIYRWVLDGGSVSYQVLVAYDLPAITRPTGFGVIVEYFDTNGVSVNQCPGYWYSNDPNDDPHAWN